MTSSQVLGEIAFSKSFGFMEAGYDIDNAIRTIDDSQWYNGIIGQIPFMDHFLRRNPLWNYVPFLATKNALITRMAVAEMENRKQNPKTTDRNDLLGQLLKGHAQYPDKFGEGDVFAVAHGAIFAGSDSTASTMQSFFHHVLKDRNVYKKVVAEIDSASLSPMVTWSEAQALPYFQACLKEAMRVRPAVGLNITRLVPQGGATIDGTWFPGGTRVAVNAWVLHRDNEVFGQDAELYRPERWLESEEKTRVLERYTFQVGANRIC